ncbi:MAG: hypothetical protein WAL59_28765, partial [Roseiarcus sp.]
PKFDCVILPNDSDPIGWSAGIEEAQKRLKAVENKAAEEIRLILGTLPPLISDAEIKRFREARNAAQNCFSSAALKGLPSMQLAAKLAHLQESDFDAATKVLETVEAEAKGLVDRLSDADRADRLRLYGLVAKWHEAVHPGAPFSACPVCDRDLMQPDAIPRDAVLDQFVVDALEQARNSKAARLETAAEWERDAMRALRGELPRGLQTFVSDDVPDDLETVSRAALSKEVFEPWASLSDARPFCEERPSLSGISGVRNAIRRVRRAINLARYRGERGFREVRRQSGVAFGGTGDGPAGQSTLCCGANQRSQCVSRGSDGIRRRPPPARSVQADLRAMENRLRTHRKTKSRGSGS